MKSLPLLVLLTLAGCMATLPADEGESKETPFYVAAGGGYAFQAFDLDSVERQASQIAGYEVKLDADDSTAFDLRAGYRVDDTVGLELQGQVFPGGDIESGGTKYSDYSGWGMFFNFKGYFTEQRATWQPYLAFGLGAMHMDIKDIEDDTTLAIKLGGGLDVKLLDRLYLIGEVSYLRPSGSIARYGMIPMILGLQFRF